MEITTFIDGHPKRVDVQKQAKAFYLGPNIFIRPFDDNNSLIIDSWNNIIDIAPKDAIDPSTRLCRIAGRCFPKTNDSKSELESIAFDSEYHELQRGINVISLCPTFSCNLACTYCFERAFDLQEPQSAENNMSSMLEEAAVFVQEAKRLYPNNPTVIELFGGEPLQHKTRNFVSNVLKLAREESVGVSIVTNGYDLLSFLDLFVLFRDVLKSVSVTLDGTAQIHNTARVTKNGKGSFEAIKRSVDAMTELRLPIRVCSNVSKLSIDSLEQLILFVKNSGWTTSPFFQFEIGRVYDRYATNRNNEVYEYEIQRKLIEIFENYRPKWLISGFMKSTEFPSKILGVDFGQNEYGKERFAYCWATSNIIRGYYLSPDMQRYRCTTTVGNHKFRLPENEQSVNTSHSWLNPIEHRSEKCLQCPIGGYCNGGCQVERHFKSAEAICDYELTNFLKFVDCVAIPRIHELLCNPSGGSQPCR